MVGSLSEMSLAIVLGPMADNGSPSQTHCIRSISRQRTTPWIAGIGQI